MLIKSYVAFLMGVFFIHACSGQEINWKASKNWKIYDLHGQAAIKCTLDTLQHFMSLTLNQDTMQTLLHDVTVWPKEKYSLWMGAYVVTCETENNKPRKLLISTYAGFFYDQTTRRYYQVPAELVDEWLDFLNNTCKQMIVTD